MLIVSKSGYVAHKGLLCFILIKWQWLTDMIKCRDAIASKNTSNIFYIRGGGGVGRPPLKKFYIFLFFLLKAPFFSNKTTKI